MPMEDRCRYNVRIGEKSIDEMECAIARALAPLLGERLQIEIRRLDRSNDAATGLEIAVAMNELEETAFAIG